MILNGSVEVTYPEGRTEILCMGNSFGVSPTMEKEYMKGVMKTKVDDCQVGRSCSGFVVRYWSVSCALLCEKHRYKPRHLTLLHLTVTHLCTKVFAPKVAAGCSVPLNVRSYERTQANSCEE